MNLCIFATNDLLTGKIHKIYSLLWLCLKKLTMQCYWSGVTWFLLVASVYYNYYCIIHVIS